jgi:hypothetical protein
MKKLIYVASFMLLTCSVFAQDLTDVLRYSNYKIKGTARASAMGNAFGALGGDFTSLSINPAGIAVYRSGEFTMTSSLNHNSIDGTYLGTTSNDSKYKMSIDNIGYVTTFPASTSNESGLVSLSFGIGFNRLADFSSRSVAGTSKSDNSILDYFTDYMNSNISSYLGHEAEALSPYYEGLAWNNYLVNYDATNKEYFNDIKDYGYKQSQQKSTDRKGYINEYVVSLGANFNHKFYLGATIGIHDLYYNEDTNLHEWYPNGENEYFQSLNFRTHLTTSGSGVNIKVGAIYKPVENLRLGVAFHSPTFYKLTDNYYNTMDSYNADYIVDDSNNVTRTMDHFRSDSRDYVDGDGTFDYKIQTPMKTVLSAAYLFGKSALISVDYEIIDYSTAKLESDGGDDYDFSSRNQTIKNAYKTIGNLHVGSEFKVDKGFSLRAGYEYYPSAYRSSYINDETSTTVSNPNSDASYSTVSGGFGFRQGNVFFDAAYKHIFSKEYANLYIDQSEMAEYKSKQNSLIFTLGYKF